MVSANEPSHSASATVSEISCSWRKYLYHTASVGLPDNVSGHIRDTLVERPPEVGKVILETVNEFPYGLCW